VIEPGVKSDLAQVFSIGGSPCAGKSSVARLLGDTHNVPVYHCDEVFHTYVGRLDRNIEPVLHKWTNWSWDRLWMQPADVLLTEAIAAYTEDFGIIVEDLRSLPSSKPAIAEATALVPQLVANELWDRRRAVWLVPSERFQRTHYRDRGPWVAGILGECAEPERAYANWMDRDAAFARWVAAAANEVGYEVIGVDGSLSLAETATVVAKHLRLEEVANTRETDGHGGVGGLARTR